ncbi:hypothetical protein BCR36DRAFT_318081 [Piromyces finnis]|uniref:DNA damage-binding protein 1 n=1 Tax=Piromyces finnis TaxID=1754191 RepID=A0A1Y1VKZ1_9FUNG|nr:hypothetical protein BCR36DRAFT_318081 [Piromyces finnis]|eukprot:ORX58556.1 hypothetical protein BCR36DRAFT_318081 [Piromyces finnis]
MFLYNLTLQQSSVINQAFIGNFSGNRTQEIIVARGSVLELLRPDSTTGKVHSVLTQEVFGIIRSIIPFRLTGDSKDYIVIGSDSGKLVILEYNPIKNQFNKLHEETYGKTGCRRIVPGQYLAADPKGRAIMLSAVEKQKLVYILNRDSSAKLTISSPLEAHKSHTIIYHTVGVDVGFENPIFACIEIDYSDADEDPTGEAFLNAEKTLTYYELDLGLNHVVRKWSEVIDSRSNYLISIPGGNDGPSGVLVCSENYITWMHQDCQSIRIPIPRRPNRMDNHLGEDEERGVIIISSVMLKMKHALFIFVQTEDGDIFKITINSVNYDGYSKIEEIKIKYFDTVPVASGMCLLKTGFLFVASETENHYLYQIENLGDDEEDQPEYSSNDFPQGDIDELDDITVYFKPRGLINLTAVDEMESLCPLIDSKIINIGEEDSPQFYTLCGRGSKSTFRILRHGLEVSEMAVSELPGNPLAVWTVKTNASSEYDSYIVISFIDATLVLSIGETVEEVTDTGFLSSTPTLDVGQLGDNTLIQIYPNGVRHIRSDRRVNEWKAPGNKTIVKAACNHRQVILGLTGGELVYFELDPSGHLNEYQEHKEMASQISCLALGPIPEGRQRSKFMAVGCVDNTIRIFSLDPDSCLQPLAMQAVNSIPESLSIIEMKDFSVDGQNTLYLNMGLQNGILLRTVIDTVTGALSDMRMRFLGTRPVKLFEIKIKGEPALLALSSRPWITYSYQSKTTLIPLSYETLEYGSSFCSEQCPEGIVAITGNTLRILTVEKLGNVFNQSIIPLKYTPRRFILHKPTNNFVIIESEQNTWCPSEKAKFKENQMDTSEGDENDELPVEQFGLPKAEPGKWASCIRVFDATSGETTCEIELDNNEAAFSITTCVFQSHPDETFVVVGTAQDVILSPRNCTAGFIRIYRFTEDQKALELVHRTLIDDIPMALCQFQGRLLVGMGKILRIYDIGKRKMLKKCENKQFPNMILTIHTQGDRIVVGDVQESVTYATYKNRENRIIIFADDTIPRWITCTTMVDYDTVVGGDKFGNFFVDRLPSSTSEEVDEDPTGNRLIYEKGYLQGAPHKVTHLCEYHVGETLSSINRATLIAGGKEILCYTTILGKIGVFIPFINREDVDFFQNLEMHLRENAPPLCGRDHLAYRSYYIPVKNVIDGNLCEQYNSLPYERKAMIAEELDKTISEVSKKIEDMRVRVAF